MSRQNDDRPYARRLNDASLRYAQELLVENERLRVSNAALASENGSLREQLEALRGERLAMQTRMQSVEEESRRYAADYVRVEQQTNNLTSLYVASYRLHSTLDRAEVLEAIKEIVVNLIGSEEFGVFQLDEQETLRLVASFGIDEASWSAAPADSLPAKVAASGDVHISDGAGEFLAVVPLRLDDRVVGVVAIFRLLPHKPELEELDRELLELLGAQAGAALYCSSRLGQLR